MLRANLAEAQGFFLLLGNPRDVFLKKIGEQANDCEERCGLVAREM